jgi:hypothetical protein
MGVVRRGILGLLLAGLLAAALVAAAFAPCAAAQDQPPTPTPAPTQTPTPSLELVETTEVVGWGVVVLFAWVVYPLVGLLLYIAALAFVTGDKSITAQVSAIVLILFAPVYTLIRSGLGGRRK